MNVYEAVEERVVSGSVLNSEGRWVNMIDQLANERRVIEELARGNVNVDGIWVSIASAKNWPGLPGSTGPAPARAAASLPPDHPLATTAPTPPASIQPTSIPLSAAPIRPAAAETPQFEAAENLLETIAMDASVVHQIGRMASGGTPAPIPIVTAAPAPAAPAIPAKTAPVSKPGSYNAAGETDRFDIGLINQEMSGAGFSGRDEIREHIERLPPPGRLG